MASVSTGRDRARKLYARIGPCERCRNPRAERHHRDGNTLNNRQSNIAILCRRCHMKEDGRLAALKENARIGRERSRQTHIAMIQCKRGHELSGANVKQRGIARSCRACQRITDAASAARRAAA
jgi:hypothetical protein